MTSLLDKYKEIIVNRHGTSSDSYMITRKIIDEINPLNTYKVSKNGLEIEKSVNSFESVNSLYSTIPEYYEFEGKWLKDSNIHFTNNINDANILGGFCKFEIDLDAMQIPIQVATENNLLYYGCKLLKINDTIKFNTEDNLPLSIISIGKDYVNDYILQEQYGGGMYLEYHKNPHFHMPMNESASGGIVLAKQNGDAYHISCFSIPFGYATYIPPYIIHNDCFLIGDYYVIYSKSEPFSTCLLKNLDNKIINISLIN
jgi:hypothetical protein